MSIWRPVLDGRTGPKYQQIVDAMSDDIASGRLAAGARMPPYRELAYLIGLSANTIARAYGEATMRGLLRGEVGRGTFVRPVDAPPDSTEPEIPSRGSTGPIDFSRNLPLAGFAEPYIRRILTELAKDPGLSSLLDYQTDRDIARHREAGRRWLDRCAVKADIDDVVPTMGGQHAVFCALMALTSPGDLLLTEALTYMPVCAMAKQLGLNVRTVAMDAEGVRPDAFEALCRNGRPRAFYLVPTLQAPTTVTLSAARRRALCDIADRHDVLLIEDDVFAPLKRNRPPALACLAPDRSIYVTSLSKAVAPGLRVGFARAPRALASALRHAVNTTIWMTPPPTLDIATRLILSGAAENIAAAQCRTARHRQTLAAGALAGIPYQADPGGLHLWIPLADGSRADMIRAQAAQAGVLVSEGRGFAPEPRTAPEALRICLSHEIAEDRVLQGLTTLAGLLHASSTTSALTI